MEQLGVSSERAYVTHRSGESSPLDALFSG
jgi:hypothetical protein